MRYLSQLDPEWCSVKIGSTQWTIGKIGCVTTSLSMITDKFGAYVPPPVIARHLEYYTNPGGLVIWGKLALPHVLFQRRLRLYAPEAIQQTLSIPGAAVMLEVNFGQHWVLAERKMWFRNDYICADPLRGKTCAAIGDYHNITGSAHFLKV